MQNSKRETAVSQNYWILSPELKTMERQQSRCSVKQQGHMLNHHLQALSQEVS